MRSNFNTVVIIFLLIMATISLSANEVSTRTAFFRSALIPGWGEISQGNNSGYAFLAAEIMLWTSMFYFNEEEDLLLKESYNYAVKYAHIDPSRKYNDEYLYHLTKYNSSGFEAGGYNAYIIERAESIEDPEERMQFIEDNIYPDEYFWEWDSKEHRRQYGIKRKDSSHFRDYAKAVTGVIIANHIFSAFNSIRISRKNKIDVKVSFNSNLEPMVLLDYKF